MKEYFDKAVKCMESKPMTKERSFYMLGYVHGLETANFLSMDEWNELSRMIDYKRAEEREREG